MAISLTSSLFTSPNFPFNSTSPSKSVPISENYKRATIAAAYATAERPATATGGPRSLYDVLGVRIGADIREIKSAYRKLARVLHPDVGNGYASGDEFMKVHSAYSTLTDPEKRAVYDRSLFPVRSGGGYKSRRWETDQCW